MMKNLFLVRHAQAVENMGRQSDLQRSLTPQGFREATRIGRKVFEMDVFPDVIIASHSERTKSTAELIAEQIKFDSQKIELSEDLYEASARTLFAFIKSLKDEWNNILIVGHNPSISYFSEFITRKEIGNVATSGLVHIAFNCLSWELVDEENCEFKTYIAPERGDDLI